MPYNTRRKSLSLPSLGIALPGGPRSARSPPSTSDGQQLSPPTKRVKRTHSQSSSSASTPAPNSPPRNLTLRFNEQVKSAGRSVAHTPPPSPGGHAAQTKIDTQGIDDTIVVAVIEQLEKTGNRPHLLKELAQVLQTTIPIVESSANPAAIISSRLAAYLKRSWTALSKCPLDKKLVGTHPKRIYYFLTTSPHQPIPVDAGNGPAAARIITPSLSSTASEEEDLDARSRDRMSPSPELDLSSPDYEDGTDQFSNQAHPPTTNNIAHNRRAQSPPLEKEEREFTQTATFLQQRRRSQEAERKREASSPTEEMQKLDVTMDDVIESQEETEESAARKNSETAAELFGQVDHVSGFPPSSPVLKSSMMIAMPPPMYKFGDAKLDHEDPDWCWSLKSPENVELHELDELLGEY